MAISLSTLKPADRSRTAEELNDLHFCPECDGDLTQSWWTLGKGSVGLNKHCEPCGQRYSYIIFDFIEEPPMPNE